MHKSLRRTLSAIAFACVAAALSAAAFVRDEPMGRWDIEPKSVVSGQETAIRLRYANGSEPLPAGSSFTMAIEPISVTQLQGGTASLGVEPTAEDQPRSAGVPPAPSPARVTVHPIGVTETGAFGVRIAFPSGLPAGQSVVLAYGNRQLDGRIVGLVNPVPVRDLAWDVRYHRSDADAHGTSWTAAGWWRNLPRCEIVAGQPSAVRVTAPSIVGAGQPFNVRLAITDAFDSRAEPPYTGSVRLIAPAGLTGIPSTVRFSAGDHSVRLIEGIRAARPGSYRIGAALMGPAEASKAAPTESNPIVVRAGSSRAIRWGILNGGAGYTAGWGDGADAYYSYARDIAGLDYAALAEELVPRDAAAERSAGGIYAARFGSSLIPEALGRIIAEAAARHHRPGEFVTILGYHGVTSTAGSLGVYSAESGPEALARILPRSMPAFPFELHASLSATEALIIHHANAAYLPYSSLLNGRTRQGHPVAPVLECHSERGMSFPGPGPFDSLIGGVRSPVAKPLFKVIGRGLRFGLVGDSGTVTGWPGRRWASGLTTRNRFVQGLTAARPSEFTRKGLLDAYRARNVYATTGERIVLDFTVNGVGMGGTVTTDGPAVATVVVSGTAPIREVSLFNGDRVLTQARPASQRDVRVAFDLPKPMPSETPYMVEVVQADRHRAWSSPIWVRKRPAPDLAWMRSADGKPLLVNAGTAPAPRLSVVGGRSSYGFVRPAWGPEVRMREGADGQVWLRRWSDRRATLFLALRCAPTSGTLRVTGQTEYAPEPDYALLSEGGAFRDDGNGLMEFADKISGGRGLAVNLTVSPRKACTATLSFTREVVLVIDGRTERAREFVIPINRVQGAPSPITLSFGILKPGERRAVPDSTLSWVADPDDSVAEINEANNLWTPPRAPSRD